MSGSRDSGRTLEPLEEERVAADDLRWHPDRIKQQGRVRGRALPERTLGAGASDGGRRVLDEQVAEGGSNGWRE